MTLDLIYIIIRLLLIYYYFIYFIKCLKIERDMQQEDYTKIWVKDSLSFRHRCIISAFGNRKSSLPLMAWSAGYWLCCHAAPRTRHSMRIGFFEIMWRDQVKDSKDDIDHLPDASIQPHILWPFYIIPFICDTYIIFTVTTPFSRNFSANLKILC